MKNFIKEFWVQAVLFLLLILSIAIAVNCFSPKQKEPQQPNTQAIIDSIRLSENQKSIKKQDSIISANLLLLEKMRTANAKKYADLLQKYNEYQQEPKDTVICCQNLTICDSLLENSIGVSADLDHEINKCNEVVFDLEVAVEERDTTIATLERLLTNSKNDNLTLKKEIDKINKKPSFWFGFGVGFISGGVGYILINK